MIRALVTGSLYGPPQARTSQAGKPYVTAKVRADGKHAAESGMDLKAYAERSGKVRQTLGFKVLAWRVLSFVLHMKHEKAINALMDPANATTRRRMMRAENHAETARNSLVLADFDAR